MVEGERRSFKKGCITGIGLCIFITVATILFYTAFVSYRHRHKEPPPTPTLTSSLDYSGGLEVKKAPDCIIIGVRKGGTKALISMLDSHPQVAAASGEVHYFDNDENFNKGMSWYINRMPTSHSGELIVEKTPSYFITPDVPKRMVESLSGKLKLILIVRDPVTRSISDYTQLDVKRANKNRKRQPFEKVVFKEDGSVKINIRVIKDSLYDVHYERWLHYFPSKHILIVNGDQLITNPLNELKQVEEYLNIKPYFSSDKLYFNVTKGFYCWKLVKPGVDHKCLGSAKGRPHSEVSENARLKLREFFRPHMANFCKLAHVDFSWCNL